MEYAPYAMALFCFESEFRRALSEKPDVLETVLRKLKGAANAGSIDVDGWSIGTWLTERLVDTLTGDDVGEIGSEGGGF
ncbi:MAG: hypothetical protein HKM98_06415 [Gammaproteobacteria bacterium]|nr:hypothetical protein [Gammaproteobacteria bacterium]